MTWIKKNKVLTAAGISLLTALSIFIITQGFVFATSPHPDTKENTKDIIDIKETHEEDKELILERIENVHSAIISYNELSKERNKNTNDRIENLGESMEDLKNLIRNNN